MKLTFFLGLLGAATLAANTNYAQPNAPDDYNQEPASVQAQGEVTPPAEISPGAAEIIRLASSGVSEDVMLAYVINAQAPFDLSADQVVYLKDLGIPPSTVTAMLNRDTTLRNQPPSVAVNPEPTPPTQPPTAPVVEGPMAPTVETTPPEDVSYFYNDLAPYGSWVTLEGVGWCWQPRTVVIAHGWRPYCDGGHWVYSDCGWFWQSDYSWGWAPFHYGRWYMHPRCGWVWTPDRVWGPAWVTWRVAGDNCGWAPLPPHAVFAGGGWRFNGIHVGINFDFGLRPDHFTFVGVHDFIGHDLRHRALPINDVRNVYRHTTIVNNTTVVRDNVIVNRGVPVDRVSAATHTAIRPAVLREGPAGLGHISNGGSRGNEPAVYRHELPSHPRPARVTAERVDSSHPIVHHNELPPVRTGHSFSGSSGTERTRTDRSFGSHTSTSTSQQQQRQSPPVYSGRENSATANPSHGAPAPITQSHDRSTGVAPPTTGRERAVPRHESQSAPVTKPVTKTAPPIVAGPKTSERFNYGRYGDTARNNPPLQSPKQSTVEPSHQWSQKSSGVSSYQAPSHDYAPKSSQQHHETYTAPASKSERTPSYTAPSQSERSSAAPSHSERSSGNSSSRDNPRDDSGSGRRH